LPFGRLAAGLDLTRFFHGAANKVNNFEPAKFVLILVSNGASRWCSTFYSLLTVSSEKNNKNEEKVDPKPNRTKCIKIGVGFVRRLFILQNV
jgi:hypothetical protein